MPLQAKEPHHQLKFKCKKCGYCCDHTFIQLYPFDVKNICGQLDITTKEFHQKYSLFKSIEGIPRCFLRNRLKCPFKENSQCTIYNFRPVRCRLFPLGRVFQENETIFVLPEEKCVGFETGKKQTIAEWLEQQEVTKSDPLTERWNKFLIKLKDDSILHEKTFPITFKKVFYDFDDEFIKKQREKLRKEYSSEDFMENLSEIFGFIKDSTKILKPFQTHLFL